MKKIYLLALVVLGFSANSFGQASATATATATIITPIAITKATDMNFGNLAVSETALGTIILSPAGTRTPLGGVTLPATTGTVSAATFNITGEADATYSISLPTTVSLLNAGQFMDLVDFTSASGTGDNTAATGILTLGSQKIFVGATLKVNASQLKGTYTSVAPFTVTVNYN